MGNGASVQPEVFLLLKEEYEKKKLLGLSDDDLFSQMKAYYESISAPPAAAEAAAPAPAPAHVDPVGEVKVDPAPVEAVAAVETSAA